MSVQKGDTVRVEYKGTLDDGTVFDSSEGRDPIEFKVGSGQIIRGFDEAVIGMKKGEEKKIHLEPKEAYGENNTQLLKKIARKVLPQDREPAVGMVIGMQRADGRQFEARIKEVSDTEVTIDLNHPLAGKALNFAIKIVEIK